jgi:predicted molibdopterin-dependent oxidoreductase YjgC
MTETAVQSPTSFSRPKLGRAGRHVHQRRAARTALLPAIQPLGESRADWQILAQVGERVGLDKPPFAASLVFKDIANHRAAV